MFREFTSHRLLRTALLVGVFSLGCGESSLSGREGAQDAGRDSSVVDGGDAGLADAADAGFADSEVPGDAGEAGCQQGKPIYCLLRDTTAPYVDPSGAPGKAIGLVVGVAKPGTRYVTGFGATTMGGTTPPGPDSMFEIASVTKVYTGYLLARGIAHKEVSLTDTLEDTFGSQVPTYNGESIDLLDLATHTSGLPDFPDNVSNPGSFNPTAGYTLKMLQNFLESYELTIKPGTTYLYSNLGVGILGHVLIKASGLESYQALVQREIAGPLALTDTVTHLDAEQQSRKVKGYAKGKPAPALDIGEPLEGGGFLKSSGDEVLRFFEGAISGNDPAWAEVMTPHRSSPNGVNASTGFLLNIEKMDERIVYSKMGGAPGFTSQVVFTTSPPAVVVILSNAAHTQGLHDLGIEVLKAIGPLSEF